MGELADRDALAARSVPFMQLNPVSDTSIATPLHKDPAIGATERFTVNGNAIVAGGAGTLALHGCDALLEHGLDSLMILDLNPDNAKAAIDAMRLKFPTRRIETRAVDVTDDVAVGQAVAEAAQLFGSIEHLVCFVGVVGCVETLWMPIHQWRRIIDINATGSFICAQAAARQMAKQGVGKYSITMVSSISAHRVNFPQPQAAYNVSKTALLSLKNCLAAEWARYGIRTNTISPGYMDTILNEGDGIKEHRKIWAERNPTGRMGRPAELTGALILLTSSASTYLNGTDIVVDGGAIVF